MPKSRNNRKKNYRRGPLHSSPLPSMDLIRKIAKELDTPELRALYRSQKEVNPSLDSEVDELTEEIKEILDHDKKSS